ncbi:MAG: hypothetical protein ACT4PV_12915 [Planctomycetaceae bacterium]
MSKFSNSISELQGKKVKFYLGGGKEGFVQGRIDKVDGNLIYIQKEGEIRGTLHTITINSDLVCFYEIDLLAGGSE